MERKSGVLRSLWKHLKDARGVSLYEITAAVAMTGILAAVAVPVVLDKVSEAKSARAVQETDTIYKAASGFQRDTGKMPGEHEGAVLLLSSTEDKLPDDASVALAAAGVSIVSDKCTSTGTGAGTGGGTGGGTGTGTGPSGGKCQDMNTFLVGVDGKGPASYQNWRGPYMDAVKTDPFDRVYMFNVRPLYKGECAGDNTFGYGWVLSGGPDRKLETTLTETKLLNTSDDIGKNYGKKITQSC